MVIGLDLDGVLVDLLTPFCQLIKEQSGVEVRPNEIKDYSLIGSVPPSAMPAAIKIMRGEDIYRRAKPYPAAVQMVEDLSKNYSVIVITSRPAKLTELTGECINTFFPSIEGIVYDRDKGRAAKRNRCRAFLDDYPKNVEDISQFRIASFLLDTSYNSAPLRGDSRFVKRVNSHSEFVEAVKSLNIEGGII